MASIAHDLDAKERTEDVTTAKEITFSSLMLSQPVMNGLLNNGYRKPSPIQHKAIPIGKCGFDMIMKSKSGTGKTAVFTIVALEMVNTAKNYTQVLILTPTREIAVQIQEVIQFIGCEKEGLVVHSFIGGIPLEEDLENVKNCHIAVGAPGRVRHLIEKGALKSKHIRLFVLDEADKLMEPTFVDDIDVIYDALPTRKQIIASSATYSDVLDAFLREYMTSPTHVSPNTDSPLLLGLQQFVSVVVSNSSVMQQLTVKTAELIRIVSKVSFTQCLIFSNYQTRVETISNTLNRNGWNSTYISGAQTQADRIEAITSLREFRCRILLSTDLTARGIDAPNVDLVINYDVPYDTSTYLHRMGRAGRFGAKGSAITIACEGEELTKLQNMLAEIGGTELSISVLPKDEFTQDILNAPSNTFEQMQAVFGTEANQHELIFTSVLDLKLKNRKEKKKAAAASLDEKSIRTVLETKQKKEKKVREKCKTEDVSVLLQNLAEGTQKETSPVQGTSDKSDDSKKRKRISENIKKENGTDVYEKNLALLGLTKLLVNDYDINNIPNEIISNVKSLIDDVQIKEKNSANKKLIEENDSGNVLSNIAQYIESESLDDVEELHTSNGSAGSSNGKKVSYEADLEESKADMETLFRSSFDYAMNPTGIHWRECIVDECVPVSSSEDQQSISVVCNQPKKSKKNPANNKQNNNKSKKKHYYYKDPKKEATCEEEAANANDYVSPFHDHFVAVLNAHSEKLAEKRDDFGSLGDFDSFFEYWRNNVKTTTEYVQQNLYLEEMNYYQYYRYYALYE